MASFCTIHCEVCGGVRGKDGALETHWIERWLLEGWEALHVSTRQILTCCGQRMNVTEAPKKLMPRLIKAGIAR